MHRLSAAANRIIRTRRLAPHACLREEARTKDRRGFTLLEAQARTKDRRGFTLLEALAAVALGGILMGIGTLRLVALVHTVRLAGAAHSVATTLRLARGRALATGESTEVRFDAVRGRFEVRVGSAIETRALPPGVAFASLPARGGIGFNGLGAGENGTIALAAGAGTRRVIVNQRGRVRVQ